MHPVEIKTEVEIGIVIPGIRGLCIIPGPPFHCGPPGPPIPIGPRGPKPPRLGKTKCHKYYLENVSFIFSQTGDSNVNEICPFSRKSSCKY